MNWKHLPKFAECHYQTNVPWMYLEANLNRFLIDHRLDMEPDFQRAHVWTEDQQIKYIEFMMKEPNSGKDIYFNHPGWMGTFTGDFVLVDGKQRLEAVRRFLRNEIPAYGTYLKDFMGLRDGMIPIDMEFIFHVAKLKTRAEVRQWYLDFNAGGTPHSKTEIDRVRELLEREKR